MASNKKTQNSQILNKKIFYTYRLTCIDDTYKNNNTEIYYMGYRSTKTLPVLDDYYSSSKTVKNLIASVSKTKFKKKILGLYANQTEAIENEVVYHKKLKVNCNLKFLNKACQTNTKFYYDNTGRIPTTESNLKRSARLLGRIKMTPEGKARVASYQKNQRERTVEELNQLSKAATERNNQTATCPHCGRVGQYLAMLRWHFDRCPKAPNPSAEGIADREKVRQNAIKRNKKPKNAI
uniref:GIY-YIG endonuclease n=1 Tax=Gonium pectorale TaxID=33097 RepID=M1VMD3_GONPE|nr:GIY-YIG endonuclease [Gonium pectorale]BAM85942.1 GIY-YIG endonuclease [Gonium pectorale]